MTKILAAAGASLFIYIQPAANAANVALLTPENATNFSHYFEGTDIWSGGSFQNGWTAGGTGSNLTLTTAGTALNASWTTGGARWLEGRNATNGTTTWDGAVVGETDPHTVEWRIRMNDNDGTNNGLLLRTGNDGGQNNLTVFENGLRITQTGGGFTFVPFDFTDDFHTIRLAVDGSVATHLEYVHVWIDGVRYTADNGNPRTTSTNDSRFIFGDGTSGPQGNGVDVDIAYIAFDGDNAYAPSTIPEPTSALLISLGALGFGLRRRRR